MSGLTCGRAWGWLLVLLARALSAPEPAAAQDDVSTVRLDGRALFQVGPGPGDADARERARRIEQRMAGLLRNLESLGRPVARQTQSGWTVVVSGVPVVSVTDRDAEDNLVSREALANQWAAALGGALDRARERRLGWGGRLVAEIRASAEAALGRLGESALTIIPRALAAIFVLALFWAIARGVRFLLRALFRRTVDDLTVESLVKQLTYYAILALGFFVAVDALGFDPSTVAAALGLTGIVLGFALKDVLSNFVSGLLLLALRPFEIGDQIVIGDLEGSVERIELRATRLRAYDGRVLLVPNAEVFTARIVNNTADPIRRGRVTAWVGYDADLQTAVDAARSAAGEAQGVLPAPAPAVRIDDLGKDDIVLEITFWTDSQRSDFKNTGSAVRGAVIAAFLEAGIGLPEPDLRMLSPKDPERWRLALQR